MGKTREIMIVCTCTRPIIGQNAEGEPTCGRCTGVILGVASAPRLAIRRPWHEWQAMREAKRNGRKLAA